MADVEGVAEVVHGLEKKGKGADSSRIMAAIAFLMTTGEAVVPVMQLKTVKNLKER